MVPLKTTHSLICVSLAREYHMLVCEDDVTDAGSILMSL